MKTGLITTLLCLAIHCLSFGQETQTIKGSVLDQESKFELIGASIVIFSDSTTLGTTTDFTGAFSIENVPVGRIALQVSYIGYQTATLQNLLLTAGKELDLTIELEENINVIEGIEITASGQGNETLNEMAVVSARSFSVEETQRYAGGFGDPARMVSAFSGVASSGDDLSNEISVRGNSPKGVLWQLEGIEIPNPNHFGSLGASGGGISMLSGSVLSRSDFYVGAFPAEFGNALSGVFDIKLRNGNPDKREHSISVGLLGVEAATEGPFSKHSKASYLIQYRYSTFALLSQFYNPIGDILPAYQDAVFKLNFPTKKYGKFSLFGLGGNNSATRAAEADSTTWINEWDNISFVEKQAVGMIGGSHFLPIGEDAYLKTVALVSADNYTDEYFRYLANENYRADIFDYTTFKETSLRLRTTFNRKVSAQHTWRVGGMYSHNYYTFNYNFKPQDSDTFITPIDGKGDGGRTQAFFQWKWKPTEKIDILAGGHATHLGLNNTFALEPRMAVKYSLSPGSQLSLAAGLHSKPEHTSTYLLKSIDETTNSYPNKEMKIQQAAHFVLGYKHVTPTGITVNTEAYYQHLFNVPVSISDNFTTLNSSSIWGVLNQDKLVSEGTGTNYGIDISVQKDFSKGYYYMVSGSLFSSTYSPLNDEVYNTRYNSNYVCNVLGGKEFAFKKNDNILGINAKFVLNGGQRLTPIDLSASQQNGYQVMNLDRYMDDRLDTYYRFDLGLSYKINKKNKTHSFNIDLQNISNRLNEGGRYYDANTEEIVSYSQTGLFPNLTYKMEF